MTISVWVDDERDSGFYGRVVLYGQGEEGEYIEPDEARDLAERLLRSAEYAEGLGK
jgi:hypothetical protein